MLLSQGFVRLPENTGGRDFIVSGLHGCIRELNVLLEAVSFDPRHDRLVATGNLVDRDLLHTTLLQWLETKAWFMSCAGSHELMLRDELSGSTGGSMTDYSGARLLRWIEGMPLAIGLPVAGGQLIGIVHADMHCQVTGADLIVMAHTVIESPAVPLRSGNLILIETGLWRPRGWLTAIEPAARCYWQVSAARKPRVRRSMLPEAGVPGPGSRGSLLPVKVSATRVPGVRHVEHA